MLSWRQIGSAPVLIAIRKHLKTLRYRSVTVTFHLERYGNAGTIPLQGVVMEQGVTLSKVQDAMQQLRTQGERVSRRNVRALTGGSMSTVHRLMSKIQDDDAQKAQQPESLLSPNLVKAIAAELQEKVRIATDALLEQIEQMKEQGEEILAELARAEEKNAALESSLKSSEERVRQGVAELQRVEACYQARETIQKQALQDAREEIQSLRSRILDLLLEKERLLSQAEHLEKELSQAMDRERLLAGELDAAREKIVDLEKNAAVTKQQLQEQKRRLAKMGKQVERALT